MGWERESASVMALDGWRVVRGSQLRYGFTQYWVYGPDGRCHKTGGAVNADEFRRYVEQQRGLDGGNG